MRARAEGRRYTARVTCANCDLSGRCPCVLRRLERLRARGIPVSEPSLHADRSQDCADLGSNEVRMQAALDFLRALAEGKSG